MQNFEMDLAGLTTSQVLASRTKHGKNKIEPIKKNQFLTVLKYALQEPMLVLLIVASIIYFLHGDLAEAIFLLAAIILVYSISHFQESRSRHALEALKALSQPRCKVIRNSTSEEIASEDVVIGDLIIVAEGTSIPADAIIVRANDFSVNESILTGESLPVEKNETGENNLVYQGTLVVSGLAICRVTGIGIQTKAGQIGKFIEEFKGEKSPLQIQIASFVKKMAITGGVVFLIIWIYNLYQTGSVIDSLLSSLTLAMSILPEEIPVAFATFMALGAWRLMQLGIIVKETRTVETLGSATVICVDKTGTITKNEMALDRVYVHSTHKIFTSADAVEIEDVITTAMWASEPIPFDPMEKALHAAYGASCKHDLRPGYALIKEYPLSGKPPIMTHVFQNKDGDTIIAAKGAPEAMLIQSNLTQKERESISASLNQLTEKGYRVLGVGRAEGVHTYPERQSEFIFAFKGLVAFYDPPKENIREVLSKFYRAGIKVKIITGDNLLTTNTIAHQVGLNGADKAITGDQLMLLNKKELDLTVANTSIFARMFPEAKLKVIEALKNQGEVVAMTGDGVNDGPALKAANIGIAMGKKGSETAKQASALILADDDLAKMVDAIAMGRKIYSNLKKGIQYIISIHIPVILVVFLPLVLGWLYPNIFSPVHVIFLELIMGPTCSIIYENEPIEQNAMDQKPRIFTKTFFSAKELSTSVVQGLVITAGLVFVYWYAVTQARSLQATSAMVFITLLTANVILTLVNRSFHYSLFTTLRYRNYLIPIAIGITVSLTMLIFLITPLREFFNFETPLPAEIGLSMTTGFLSVVWFEIYKWSKRTAGASG